MKPTRAVMILALAGSLGGCADSGAGPSAPEERQLTGPQFAPPSGPTCHLGFNLELTAGKVTGDPSPFYSDKVDKVLAFTGGEGFRFDTNGPQSIESPNDIRKVTLDLRGTGHDADAQNVEKGINLQFDSQHFPINLCAMQIPSDTTEPAGLNFVSSVPGLPTARLWYGLGGFGVAGCPPADVSSPLTVTRESPNVWTVSGTTACLAYQNPTWGAPSASFAMPISFKITSQKPAPLP